METYETKKKNKLALGCRGKRGRKEGEEVCKEVREEEEKVGGGG